MDLELFDRVKKGDLDYIKTVKPYELLKAREQYGVSILSTATTNDHLDCCKEILKKCPSLLYHQSDQQNTVLHNATYCRKGIYRMVDFFVSFGLDEGTKNGGENMVRFKRWIKLQNHNEDTALTQAAYYQSLLIVKRLVEVDRQHKLGLSEIHGNNGKTALQLAVEYQDQEMIEILTGNGEGDTYSNYIPLSISVDLFDHVRYGDLEYIKTVELDVLLNSRDEKRNSALLIATKYNQLDCCEEILKRCPSLLYHQANCKDTVLHYATYYKSGIPRLIELFVRVGLDAATNEGNVDNKERENMGRFKNWMRLQNNYSNTALTQAAFYQNLHIVKMLVEVDSQYKLGLSEIVGYKSKTALQLASEYQDREMIKLLTDKGDPYSKIVPLSIAKVLFARAKFGDLDYIKRVELDVLLNSRDEARRSVLCVATEYDQLDCCKEILNRCPLLLYLQTIQYNTVLHDATYLKRRGISRLIDLFVTAGLDAATSEGDAEGENMIRFKIWITSQNHNGDTALTQAAYYRNLHIVKTLVEVDRQNNLGLSQIAGYNKKTALQLAEEYHDLEMVKLLTDEGDPYSNYIPLSISMDLFDRVEYGDLEYIKSVELDVLKNSRDEERNSVLLIATKYDQLDCCEEILKRCPSLLYHQANTKENVLHYATYYKNGIPRLIDFFLRVSLDAAKDEDDAGNRGENMIHFKKWIKLQNHNADTALTQASYYHNHDIVKKLVEVDCQYKLGLSEIVGYNEKTALQLALEYQDHEMIQLLTDIGDLDLDYGANIQISMAIQQAQESLPTGNSRDTGVASKSNIFSLAEISIHNNSKDCWLVISGKVYDVTGFLRDHPGGGEILLKATGKDATNDFEKVHSHTCNAMTMMDKFFVGVYDPIASLLTKLVNDRPQEYSQAQVMDFMKDFPESIGSGGFGDVYKGKLPNGVLIAVKILKDTPDKEKIMVEQFGAEVDTMGRTYHRNLIRLYGYCYDAKTKFKALIYDYMESGSLKTILFEKKLDLPWEKLHNIAKEIAQGISYLHESCRPQIIHLDIKPDNVLLDSNLSPKVIDFGLAKVNMGESQFDESKVKGTCNYMAPEVNQLGQVKLSCKCDVYSFGMVLFDILGSKRNHVDKRFWFPGQVWEKFRKDQLDKFILDCGIKEEDKDNARRLSIVALLCVEHIPAKRPMMSTVAKMLEGKINLDSPDTPFSPYYYPLSDSSSSSETRDV